MLTNASRTGLGITLWQKQNDDTIRPIAFSSRYLNDGEKNLSTGELKLLAVVWGVETVRFYLYGKVVHHCTDHQALESLLKRNQAYQENSARSGRLLDRLAYFDISMKHTAGKNSASTDYHSRHLNEEATTEETLDEEYVINILSKLFELNHKYGKLLNTDRKFCPGDQSTKMKIKANRESTNEIAPPKNSIRTPIQKI